MTTLHRIVTGTLVVALLATTQAIGRAQSKGAGLKAGIDGSVAAAPATPEFRIGPEDVLDIVVWKNADLSVRGLQVRPDGRISLPLANDVAAAGLTPMELRAAITRVLDPFYPGQIDVSVTVREVHSIKISVFGLVKMPNRYELKSQITVLDALSIAGGFADFASKDQIYVLRRDGTRIAFNYEKFIKNPTSKDNLLLQSGDVVIVP